MTRMIVLALMLAGCSAAKAPPEPVATFRDRSVPIGSVLSFDAARFAGVWDQVAHFPGACAGAKMQVFEAEPLMVETLCGGTVSRRTLTPSGPGRFDTAQGPLWLLWVDEGYRTAVLGRPDGSIGAIWNRGAAIPQDRFSAAREILDFNGYDLTRLIRDGSS